MCIYQEGDRHIKPRDALSVLQKPENEITSSNWGQEGDYILELVKKAGGKIKRLIHTELCPSAISYADHNLFGVPHFTGEEMFGKFEE